MQQQQVALTECAVQVLLENLSLLLSQSPSFRLLEGKGRQQCVALVMVMLISVSNYVTVQQISTLFVCANY